MPSLSFLSMALLASCALTVSARRATVPVDKVFDREARRMSNKDFLQAISSSHSRMDDGEVPADFECAWRNLAYKYAQQLQPTRTAANFQDIFDSLELSALCNQTFDAAAIEAMRVEPTLLVDPTTVAEASSIYVDPVNGNDGNSGSQQAPVQHVAVALRMSRALPPPASIILRAGVHRIVETIALGPADAGLTIMAFPGESPVLSSGLVISPSTWTPYNVTPSDGNFTLYPNVDAMYNDWPDPAVLNLSATTNYQDCQAACAALSNPTCNAFIWYDPQVFGPPYGGICFGRTDATFSMTPQNSTWSGRRTPPTNIYVATVTGIPDWVTTTDEFVLSLLYSPDGGITTSRATRARYPNANNELEFYPSGWSHAGSYQPGVLNMDTTVVFTNLTDINYPGPGQGATMFTNFYNGEGGPCSRYTPQMSYWCQPYGRVAGGTYFINTPAGFIGDASVFPNAPFTSDLSTAIFNYFRNGHWFSMMTRVSGYNATNNTLTFGYGGFQGAEGESTGEAWFIENVFEELDYPNEFYYDAAAGKLYYFNNATAGTPPPLTWTWEVPLLQTLISITGDQSVPATDITIQGITFTSAAPSFLAPHGTPSGGDWGLSRNGAIFLEGTESVTISDSVFTRIDGNGVFISGYNRNATVFRNEFVWVGDSAIASWGYADDVDATAGAQPWFNNISMNICHEIGITEKQSSCYFQAVTGQTTIEGNIFYNGPRAMVNFNDGMPPGGSMLTRNLAYNTCRETSDHGAFNSWDRVPYYGYVNGVRTVYMNFYEISYNFFVANYGSDGGAVDNDDGSSRYLIHHNVAVFGGAKSDFDGHQKLSYSNLMAFANVYGPRCYSGGMPLKGVDPNGAAFDEGYYNNTCILASAGDEYLSIGSCSTNPAEYAMVSNNNRVFAPNSSVTISCAGSYNFTQWMSLGLDTGSTIGDLPDTPTIIGWAASLLNIAQ